MADRRVSFDRVVSSFDRVVSSEPLTFAPDAAGMDFEWSFGTLPRKTIAEYCTELEDLRQQVEGSSSSSTLIRSLVTGTAV
jgi:hypothetical protein